MKAKKVLITLLALGTALSFTACNGGTTEKETAKTESAKTESSKYMKPLIQKPRKQIKQKL